MKQEKARSLAAVLLKTGESKIWVSPSEKPRISEAMTKEDLRALIKDGVVKELKENQKNTKRNLGRKKYRKRGHGKRKGTAKARIDEKRTWIKKVRAQRKKLRELKKEPKKMKMNYRKAYNMVKGGYFRGKKHLEATLAGEKR